MIYTKCVGLNFCSGPDVYCCGSVAAASVVVYTCIGAAIDIAIYIKCAIFAGKEYGTIYGYIFSDVDLAVFAGITLSSSAISFKTSTANLLSVDSASCI